MNVSNESNYRTHYCGEVDSSSIGQSVSVSGWVQRRREHGEKLAFIDLRDHTGIIQCVVDGKVALRSEFVVKITGVVQARPEGTVNQNITTGEIEITECEVEILNSAEPSPIPLDDWVEVDENMRLRHRYLDLRRERMQRNLRVRADVNAAFRAYMDKQGFLEMETPLLIVSTPEGARDFVVPSRMYPGSFYALPQSPQIFKQLAMVGGIDRYYQIARCLRDEDLRADRQFEFMQLDVEASFVNAQEIISFISGVVRDGVDAALKQEIGSSIEFQTMTYEHALENYGSDKPDTRFGMTLIEVTPLFENTGAKVFQAECLKAIGVEGGATGVSRAQIDELTEFSINLGAKGLAWFRVEGGGTLDGPLAKFLSPEEISGLISETKVEEGDLILVVADVRRVANKVLGQVRLRLGSPKVAPIENLSDLHFVWVTEFPLFEDLDQEGNPIPAHHLFTMPHPEDINLLVKDGGQGMLNIRSLAYDLVLNGWELGSGSIRIHKPEIQERVFAALGLSDEVAQERFGYLLEAYKFGAPPHGGFALGVDRFVAMLLGEENIREVIAFPKTQTGQDPLTSAPGRISERHLKELGIEIPQIDKEPK